jgi:ubiquitin-conjugating enzyme E2 Z
MSNIKKETLKRLLLDIKNIVKNPLTDNGIYYIHDDTEILKGYAMIIGPRDTPYFGGAYFFEFKFPTDYPYSPPKVQYLTNYNNIRFNPNLYRNGKVCVSILNTWKGENWNSCQTISTVLLNLFTLLSPNPLLNEPGITTINKDFHPYNEIIEYVNIEVAIIKILNKENNFYIAPIFDKFYDLFVDEFKKNKNDIIAFIESKIITTPAYICSVSIYGMRNLIDYVKLKNDIENITV